MLKLPVDEYGFEIRPDEWWEGKVTTEYGSLTPQFIIELLSERHNVGMYEYVRHTDEQLKGSYEESWENLVSDRLEPKIVSDGAGGYVAREALYPELMGRGSYLDEAEWDLEHQILMTNDCRFRIRW